MVPGDAGERFLPATTARIPRALRSIGCMDSSGDARQDLAKLSEVYLAARMYIFGYRYRANTAFEDATWALSSVISV